MKIKQKLYNYIAHKPSVITRRTTNIPRPVIYILVFIVFAGVAYTIYAFITDCFIFITN